MSTSVHLVYIWTTYCNVTAALVQILIVIIVYKWNGYSIIVGSRYTTMHQLYDNCTMCCFSCSCIHTICLWLLTCVLVGNYNSAGTQPLLLRAYLCQLDGTFVTAYLLLQYHRQRVYYKMIYIYLASMCATTCSNNYSFHIRLFIHGVHWHYMPYTHTAWLPVQ